MRHNESVAGAIRALPQPERSNALRSILRRHFGNAPGIVCSRAALEARANSKSPPAGKQPKAAIVLVLLIACVAALAPIHQSKAVTWRLDANLASVHTERWARESLNQRNPGLGFEWSPSRTWTVAAGEYWNSYRRVTTYALGEWTPIQLGDADGWHLDAGVGAGFASGYHHNEVPTAPFVGAAVVRLVSPGGFALNVVSVPNAGAKQSGFLGFQLAVPISR